MDERIRYLYRQFAETGTPEDGLAYYSLLYKIELGMLFQGAINHIALSSPSFRSNNPPSIIYVTLCYRTLSRWIEGNFVRIPSYNFTVHTLSKYAVTCHCGRSGAHTCTYTSYNYDTLPGPYLSELFATNQTLRDYTPQPESIRKGQSHTYHIHRWDFTTFEPNDYQWSHGEWYLANNRRVAGVSDHQYFPTTRHGFYRDYFEFSDFRTSNRSFMPRQKLDQNCLVILDAIDSHLPIPIPHQLPSQPPYPMVGPCENFRLLPKGGEIYIPGVGYVPSGGTVTVMTGPTMSTERVIDTSTECGHGYVEAPWGIFPLCPPKWSDTGEVAGKHCEGCLKILPTDYVPPKQFVYCEDCFERMRKQSRLHEWLDYRQGTEETIQYYCEECDEVYGADTPEDEMCPDCDVPLHKQYFCPFHGRGSYYDDHTVWDTPQEAIDCCTKITPVDYPKIFEVLDEELS